MNTKLTTDIFFSDMGVFHKEEFSAMLLKQ